MNVRITRVVTRNWLADLWSRAQDIFGKRMTNYEKMIGIGYDQIFEEVHQNGWKMKWYRIEMTLLTNNAIALLFYGETE
jgi:hypothetical protein